MNMNLLKTERGDNMLGEQIFEKPVEVEITKKDGTKRYEIAYSIADFHAFIKLHDGKDCRAVNRKRK